ncbi:MAG: Xaa-Pro peptidase family protein [Bacillota bacterium]
MNTAPTKQELLSRIERFITLMSAKHPDWDTAIIINKVNQYYFTGTMQDALLIIKRSGELAYFIRRSLERAKIDSPLDCLFPMESYKDVVEKVGAPCGNTYLELEVVPVSMLERMKKHLKFENIASLDRTILQLRAVKSPYELHFMKESGAQHKILLEEIIPSILKEGMTEADLIAETFEKMYKLGFQGLSRFGMFQTEMLVGQIGFGANSLIPSNFDGPGGAIGLSAATPFGGSRERRLQKGDLVFADIAYGVNGYHSDKTQVYSFGAMPTQTIASAHATCLQIQAALASQLVPGKIPALIYDEIINKYSDIANFMGFGTRQAKFFGHGVGLVIDEHPVIAYGFNSPLEENMVLALEPKIGIANIGMVGVEDTYIVTPNGGQCITGGGREIITLISS